MREQILKLRKDGLTYNQIVEQVGCAKSTVAYHLGKGQKEATRIRSLKNRDQKNRKRKRIARKMGTMVGLVTSGGRRQGRQRRQK